MRQKQLALSEDHSGTPLTKEELLSLPNGEQLLEEMLAATADAGTARFSKAALIPSERTTGLNPT